MKDDQFSYMKRMWFSIASGLFFILYHSFLYCSETGFCDCRFSALICRLVFFEGMNPRLVRTISGSKSIRIAGRTVMTRNVLISAPRARSVHIEEIREILE